MPSFFSWQIETVLFVLAEKEKNGFKKAFLWVRRKPEEAGGQSRPPLQKGRGGNIAGGSERRCAERGALSDSRDGCDGRIKAEIF